MLPLVKKGMTVEFELSGEKRTAKVFNANIKTVWIELESGGVLKLHKRKHKIKVIEPSEVVEGRKEDEKPSKKLDDLFAGLPGGPASS